MADTSQTMMEVQKLDSLLSSGSDLLQEDKLEQARDCFEKALQINPSSEKALGLLGLTHFRLSEFEPASGVYQQLVEMNSEDASYRLNLGLVHLKLGRATLAIRELSKSRELDPSQIRTVSYLGLAHARNGEYSQAFEAFLRAEESNLASEMEQYLSVDEVEEIRRRVADTEATETTASIEEAEVTETSPSEAMFPASTSADSASADSASADSASADSASADSASADSASADSTSADSASAASASEFAAPEPAPTEPEVSAPAASEPVQNANSAEVTNDGETLPPLSAEGVISRALDIAVPTTDEDRARAASELRDPAKTPIRKSLWSIAEFSKERLLRPEESRAPLEVGAGGVLIAQVDGKLISRTEGVMISSGELGFEPATRRIRGQQSDEVFGSDQEKLFLVTGKGYMVASAGGEVFTALRLDDDVLYLREEYLFAFEPKLRWENGRIPGSELQVAQFRGHGCVAIRSPKALLSIQLSGERVLYVEADVLAGWTGKVVPRQVKPAAGGLSSTSFVECSGEGVVLMHDLQASE